MSSINFDNVYLLFIAIPLLLLLTVPFFIAVKKDNANGHNIASLVLHVLMAALIAFAAAGTHIVTVVTETDVYVVADVSYSANKNLDAVDGYIADLSKNLPRNSKLGVVCFGKDFKITTELGKKLKPVKDSGVDDTETNIIEALDYTGSLFKNGVIKRIVLVTDGKQTYTNDPNDLMRTVSALQAQGVKVDAIYLNDNIDMDNVKEVQISSAEYTKSAFKDRDEQVVLNVQSSYITNSIVTLYKDGAKYLEKPVELSRGNNSVSFNLDTSEEGGHDYRAELSALASDECAYNNTYSFSQSISAAVSVLLISESEQSLDKVKGLYDETTQIKHYALSQSREIPVSVEDLCEYDEIILDSVDLTNADNYEMFLSSLNTAVSFFGKSLLTFGNLKVQDKTEGELKQLDDILPVRYGGVDTNPKLYTLVLDVSHSFDFWSRAIIAKKAAVQLVNFLSDSDYVCIVAFAGNTQVSLTPTSLANREEVIDTIYSVYERGLGNGTRVSSAFKRTLETIRNLNFSQKQVMLITDGLAYDGEISDYEDIEGLEGIANDREYAAEFVRQMRDYKIYTSVLQVGGGNLNDRAWLRNISVTGGGSYYLAETENDLGDVLFGDIIEDVQKYEIDSPSFIKVEKTRDDVLKYENEEGEESIIDLDANFVSSYVLNSAKSSATTVLSVTYKSGKISQSVPLYSYWNFGNGKVASYAGKLGEIQVYGGALSQSNSPFFTGVTQTGMPEEKITYPFLLTTQVEGKRARVELTPAQLHASAVAGIKVNSPAGEEINGNFIFDSSIYYYEFSMPEIGNYKINVNYSYGETQYSAETQLTLSYEPEYDAFEVFEASVLYKMLNGDGTVSEDGKLVIENDDDEIKSFTVYLTLPFLIAAVVLYVVDIAVRKLKWNDIVSLFGRGKGKGGSK